MSSRSFTSIATITEVIARTLESYQIDAGDMFESLPAGHDVHLFANAFHDWGVDSVRRLAANAFQTLPHGGLIAVFDAHLNPNKDGPLAVAEYSCLLMHSTEGRCYSTAEIDDILTAAGFTRIRVTDIAADRTLITGRKA